MAHDGLRASARGGRVTGVVLVFLGAGLGGVLRYGVTEWAATALGARFPSGTLIVNVLGCFLIGFLAPLVAGTFPMRDTLRLALFVGLLGGFTTFSTFGRETLGLLQDGRLAAAGLYFLGNNALGLLAAWVGLLIGPRILA